VWFTGTHDIELNYSRYALLDHTQE
jgi:hypothetical protein